MKQLNNEHIVFLPGWGFKCSVWQSIASEFNQSLLLDFPVENNITLNHIGNFFSQKIPDNSIIIGWSLGGMVALNIAKLFPQKCKKLILVASTPKFVTCENWDGMHQAAADDFFERAYHEDDALLQHFIKLVQFPNRSSLIREYLTNNTLEIEKYKEYLKLLFQSDLRAEYERIAVPILHVLGSNDALVRSQASNFKQLNGATSINVINGAGHVPFLSHKQDFLKMINEFINK